VLRAAFLGYFRVLASMVLTTGSVAERRLVIGLEWAILGSRQVCFARAPAFASAYADLTACAGSAAPTTIASADSDAVAAAAAGAARFCAFMTRASAAATVIVAASSLTVAIIKGFEWVKLGSGQVCFGFGRFFLGSGSCASDDESSSSVSTEHGLFSCSVRSRFGIGSRS